MKNRGATRRSWVKFWITGWLHGSIRWQLDPSERATWADLICMAGECSQNGQIADNDGRPLPIEYIANTLNIPLTLLGSTIAKCKAEGRIENREDGVIAIANWNVYQSEYERQKNYRPKNKNTQTFDEYKEQLRKEFSDLDFDEEVKKFQLWWDEGDKKLKRPKSALRNWLVNARKFKQEQKDGPHKPDFKKVGKNEPYAGELNPDEYRE